MTVRSPRHLRAIPGRNAAGPLETPEGEFDIRLLARAVAVELNQLWQQPDHCPALRSVDTGAIVIGSLRVDLEAYEVAAEGSMVPLKPREFALLKVLAQNAGRAFTRDHLIALAWPDPAGINSNRTVDVHVRRLRLKLGSSGTLIQTVFGIGYKLARR